MWKQIPADKKLRYTVENYPPPQKTEAAETKKPASEAAVATPRKEDGVRIIHSDAKATVAGRSKVELTADEEDEDEKDEEDFYFNGEDSHDDDDDCDIIDDDDNNTADNQEIFDDDDD